MNFKKGILGVILASTLLAGCAGGSTATSSAPATTPSPSASAEPADVHVSAMKGPTAMGMVKMMDDADNGEIKSNNYSFEILSSVDEIAPKVAQKEVDIAAVPANLGSVLYNNTDKGVVALAVNTLGVLYICETGDSIHSISDLAGKTIYASGKGATPEYALNYILQKNGIADQVTIEWKSEHSECVAAMAQDPNAIALLPEPFVTSAKAQNSDIRAAIDLNDAWDDAVKNEKNKSSLLTGIVIARKEFVEEHPEAVKDFLDRYKDSVAFTNDNIDDASALIEKYDIIKAAVARNAVPNCHIVDITGDKMKNALSGYLQVLYDQNPKAVGGSLPEDDFYYGAE